MRNGMSAIEMGPLEAYLGHDAREVVKAVGKHNFRGCDQKTVVYRPGLDRDGTIVAAAAALDCPRAAGFSSGVIVDQDVGAQPDPEQIRNKLNSDLELLAAEMLCHNCVYAETPVSLSRTN